MRAWLWGYLEDWNCLRLSAPWGARPDCPGGSTWNPYFPKEQKPWGAGWAGVAKADPQLSKRGSSGRTVTLGDTSTTAAYLNNSWAGNIVSLVFFFNDATCSFDVFLVLVFFHRQFVSNGVEVLSDVLSEPLFQCWSRSDGNIHCPGQALAAHSGSWVCGHPRAGVRNAVIPDVYGTDRGRNIITGIFKFALDWKTSHYSIAYVKTMVSIFFFFFASAVPSFLLCTFKLLQGIKETDISL